MKKNLFLILLLIVQLAHSTSRPKLLCVTSTGGIHGGGTIIHYLGGDTALTSEYGLPPNSTQLGGIFQACNGKIYGLTYDGNTNGVLYEYDYLRDSITKIIYPNLNAYATLMQANDGKLYAPAYGVNSRDYLFSYTIGSDSIHKLYTFPTQASPKCSLIQSRNGKLYGMTSSDGNNLSGTIFEYDINADSFSVKHSLPSNAIPNGSLIETDTGTFYGFTCEDGSHRTGTIFKYILSTNTYTVLYNFPNDSLVSLGTPIIATDGKIYGTRGTWNANSYSPPGNLFSFDLTSNTYTNIHNFLNAGNNEYDPICKLFQASDSMVYGTTTAGGGGGNGYGYGSIFRYDIYRNQYFKEVDLDITINNGGGFPMYGAFIEYRTPPLISPPANISSCADEQISFTATCDSTPVSVQWQMSIDSGHSFVLIPNINIDSLTFVGDFAQNGNQYRAIFYFTCHTDTSDAALLTIYPRPQAIIGLRNNDTLFTNVFRSYHWFRNGVSIDASDSSYLAISQEGNYTVFVVDSNGCSDTSSVYVVKSLGLSNLSNLSNVSVYPNPNNGSFTLGSCNIGYDYAICDLLGRQICQQKIISEKQSVAIDNLIDGSYILTIKGTNDVVKFTVNH